MSAPAAQAQQKDAAFQEVQEHLQTELRAARLEQEAGQEALKKALAEQTQTGAELRAAQLDLLTSQAEVGRRVMQMSQLTEEKEATSQLYDGLRQSAEASAEVAARLSKTECHLEENPKTLSHSPLSSHSPLGAPCAEPRIWPILWHAWPS